MLRRLFTLMLAIACACAPGIGALAANVNEADACCCGSKCPCPPMDRGPARSACVNPAPVATAAVGQRAVARKGVMRVARAAFAPFVFASDGSAPASRRSATVLVAPAASVALFQAHCSLLI